MKKKKKNLNYLHWKFKKNYKHKKTISLKNSKKKKPISEPSLMTTKINSKKCSMNKILDRHPKESLSIKKIILIIINKISKTLKLNLNPRNTPNPKNHSPPPKGPKKKPNHSWIKWKDKQILPPRSCLPDMIINHLIKIFLTPELLTPLSRKPRKKSLMKIDCLKAKISPLLINEKKKN